MKYQPACPMLCPLIQICLKINRIIETDGVPSAVGYCAVVDGMPQLNC
ncbi:hypothetical protein IQ268_24995 [Oculatella sp. LEGE 06141]|nr:hypothetical protein [Oculatella sp. LEGE 06141]MBE9181829.1 hypothetical protein [Oculatella sp. LEGE 06141]